LDVIVWKSVVEDEDKYSKQFMTRGSWMKFDKDDNWCLGRGCGWEEWRTVRVGWRDDYCDWGEVQKEFTSRLLVWSSWELM
jgi:hypothetical protein